MSDLFCPATLIVVRHAEAVYETPGVISDDGGELTDVGREQARRLAKDLGDRRIAAVWCSDMSRAVQTAEVIAAALDVPVRVRRGLREASVGALAGGPQPNPAFDAIFQRWLDGDLAARPPGAESGADVLSRMTVELEALSDQFRGESVVIVGHGGAISLALPQLADNVRPDYARGRPLPNCAVCELSVDSDGWVLHTWAGEPV